MAGSIWDEFDGAAKPGIVRRAMPPSKFDPESDGYDMDAAVAAGLGSSIDPSDGKPHWPSRDPNSGLLLKGRKHPTWNLLEQGELEAGMEIFKGDDGRYYSRPKGTK